MHPLLCTIREGLAAYNRPPKYALGSAVLIDGKRPGIIVKASRYVCEWPDENDPARGWRAGPWMYEIAVVEEGPIVIGRAFDLKGIQTTTVGEHRLTAYYNGGDK